VLLVMLLAVAFFTKEDLLLVLLYAVFGLNVVGRLWARRALAAVAVSRHHDQRAFLWETVPVKVEVVNRGRLPVLWARLSDTIPLELAPGARFQHVLSLLPRERLTLSYTLHARRRGYYSLGPIVLHGGDVLGTAAYETHQAQDGHLVVYPRIVALPHLALPSHSPLGTLPSRQRLFEDPSRIRGVRPYQAGDSLRRIDWKTSARTAALQVRRLEPAIALETAIVLNLDGEDYPGTGRYDATELAISIAASLAVHVSGKRQAVGLATNGRDPLPLSPREAPIPLLRRDRRTVQREAREACPVPDRHRGPGEGSVPLLRREGPGEGLPLLRREGPGEGSVPLLRREGPGEVSVPLLRREGLGEGLPLRKGHEHLLHVLDLLARIEVAGDGRALPFLEMLGASRNPPLPWGSTLVAITSHEVEGLMETLLALRRRGLAVLLVLTSAERDAALTVRRAAQIGVQAVQISSERELRAWQ